MNSALLICKMYMINRSHIENILKINGVSSAEPDEIIRSVLLSARYNKNEVDTALMVLRQDIDTKEVRVEGLHKVFYTNDSLLPQEISSLLGVDLNVDSYNPEPVETRGLGMLILMVIWLCSVGFAVFGILLYMHAHNIGLFHPSVA